MGRRVGVVGASGTIASQLIRRLTAIDGFDIIALARPQIDIERARRIGLHSPVSRDRITLLTADLYQLPERVNEFVEHSDLVCYLAGISASRPYTAFEAADVLLLNGVVPYLIARMCRELGRPFIYPSSMGVYELSRTQDLPLHCDTVPLHHSLSGWLDKIRFTLEALEKRGTPAGLQIEAMRRMFSEQSSHPGVGEPPSGTTHAYLQSKLLAERLLSSLGATSGFRVLRVRFENEYGPGAEPDYSTPLGQNKRVSRQLLALAAAATSDPRCRIWNETRGIPQQLLRQSHKPPQSQDVRAFTFGENIHELLAAACGRALSSLDALPPVIDFAPKRLRLCENALLAQISLVTGISVAKYLNVCGVRDYEAVAHRLSAFCDPPPRTVDTPDGDPVVTDLLGEDWHRTLIGLDKGLPVFLEWLNSPSVIRWNTVPTDPQEVGQLICRYDLLRRGRSEYEGIPRLKERLIHTIVEQLRSASQLFSQAIRASAACAVDESTLASLKAAVSATP